MAKRAGMKVTEFFLGFGPRLWSVQKGETEYGIKAIPAGAYVRIIGMHNLEEVAPEDEDRTYREWYSQTYNGRQYRDYNKLSKKNRQAYWKYRHEHDKDHDHDHDRH